MFSIPGVRRVNALPALSTLRLGHVWDPQFLAESERRLAETGWRRTGGHRHRDAPANPLSEAERIVVTQLMHDGRAPSASIARVCGLATSTAHRVVRRVLDERWGQTSPGDRVGMAGLQTPFVLRLRVAPGDTPDVMSRLKQLPRTRVAVHVASDLSILCTGLVTDRSALAIYIDHELAKVPGILTVGAAVMLAEPRRYWLDRDLTSGLG
jgi:DNA-binding Lrp family transcriptional regulator